MITILLGLDRTKILDELQKIIAASSVAPERPDPETLSASDLPSLLTGTNLFSEQRLVILKDLAETPLIHELDRYVARLSKDPDLHLVLVEKKLDKRTGAYKSLKPYIREFNEIEKPDFSSFSLLPLAMAGKFDELNKILENLETKEDPHKVFGLLSQQTFFTVALANSSKSLPEIAADLKTTPFQLKNLPKLSPQKAASILNLATKTDLNLKTTGADPWLLVKTFLFKLSSLR